MDRDGGYDPSTPMCEFASAWARSSREFSRGVGQMYRSIARANRAFVPGADDRLEDETVDRGADTEEVVGCSDWETERSVDRREELDIGDYVRFSKAITDEDVVTFAGVSGDTNRLHLDDEFAARTRFGDRIAHGTLVSGLVSAALARLPGLTIYLSQDLEFLRPVDIGDRLTAVVEIVEDIGNGRYRLTTVVEGESGEPVVDGEAVVVIDEPPADDG